MNVKCYPLHIIHQHFQINAYDLVLINYPDSKVHGTNMGPTWVLLAPGGSHVTPINLAICVTLMDLIELELYQTLAKQGRMRIKRARGSSVM